MASFLISCCRLFFGLNAFFYFFFFFFSVFLLWGGGGGGGGGRKPVSLLPASSLVFCPDPRYCVSKLCQDPSLPFRALRFPRAGLSTYPTISFGGGSLGLEVLLIELMLRVSLVAGRSFLYSAASGAFSVPHFGGEGKSDIVSAIRS